MYNMLGEKMETGKIYDISEICEKLGTTSRTLRYYESQGLIQSTKHGVSSRRKYTERQLYDIKNVMALRSLGLSVKAIREIQNNNADLKDMICSKRAEIYALIDSNIRKINFLNEVLFSLDSENTDITALTQKTPEERKNVPHIIGDCTDAILNGKTDILYGYMSERMKQYLPKKAYEKIREDTFRPLGTFLRIEKPSVEENSPNKFIQFIRFTKLGLKITFVIYNDLIEGIWLGYYNAD